ncbi:MAG: tetratricopeptide repeat protein, partial [Planctomycetota bacterium]
AAAAAVFLRSRFSPWPSGSRPASGPYLGSAACRDCHEPFYEKWSTSWHGLAMRPYTPEFARANLAEQTEPISIGGRPYRAAFEGDRGFVVESAPDGERRLPIAHVLGGKNVFYFLTPYRGGRLQVLPLAFDARARVWFDAMGSMVRHFREERDEALAWTDRLLTFNASCFGCHVSQLSNRYDLETDSYETAWTEPGINCETCHGPGDKHVEVSLRSRGRAPEPLEIVRTGAFTAEEINSLCGSCHAKITPLTRAFLPGGRFFDHFNLAALEDRDLYPDGRELGENYTYALFLLSPCRKSERFHCMHCHTSSGRDKHAAAGADKACLPCHERHVADPAAHSFHKTESEGSRCRSCHMPRTVFARMQRHDHSLLPPAPAATLEFGSPNACTLCHPSEGARWAEEHVRKWYPRDYQAPLLRRARLVQAARARDGTPLDEMVAYVASPERNEVFAAGILRLLESSPRPAKWPAFFAAVRDPSPLVRAAACRGLGASADGEALEALIDATADEYRLVRIEAAGELAHRPLGPLDPKRRRAVDQAIAEYREFLAARPDDPTSHYNVGNYYLEAGSLPAAVAAYELALRLEPSFLPALVNLSMAWARSGDPARAESALRRALGLNPRSPEAHFNLALLLAERGERAEAKAHLERAVELDPRSAQAAYNLAIVVSEDDLERAIALARRAAELLPEDPRYGYTLAFYEWRAGRAREAEATLRAHLERHPADADALGLLAQILEEAGRADPQPGGP